MGNGIHCLMSMDKSQATTTLFTCHRRTVLSRLTGAAVHHPLRPGQILPQLTQHMPIKRTLVHCSMRRRSSIETKIENLHN